MKHEHSAKDGEEVIAWEQIDETTERLKVHNGWLVHRVCEVRQPNHHKRYDPLERVQVATAMVFVVDQLHQWKLKEGEG